MLRPVAEAEDLEAAETTAPASLLLRPVRGAAAAICNSRLAGAAPVSPSPMQATRGARPTGWIWGTRALVTALSDAGERPARGPACFGLVLDRPRRRSLRRRYDIVRDVSLVRDTAMIVAAMRSPSGASGAILRAARQGRITLLRSVALPLEYEAVCSKAEHRLALGLTVRQVDVFIAAVIASAEPVETQVLEAAVNGGADALVTFNLRDFGQAPLRFGIELLLP